MFGSSPPQRRKCRRETPGPIPDKKTHDCYLGVFRCDVDWKVASTKKRTNKKRERSTVVIIIIIIIISVGGGVVFHLPSSPATPRRHTPPAVNYAHVGTERSIAVAERLVRARARHGRGPHVILGDDRGERVGPRGREVGRLAWGAARADHRHREDGGVARRRRINGRSQCATARAGVACVASSPRPRSSACCVCVRV